MTSRFGPPGESRYPPRERDRSPPRFERRGSNQHPSPILPRNNDTSYRPGDSSAASTNSRDGPRDPPRGPRLSHDGPRGGSYAPRGRGYGPRESRDSQFSRRESDRDWQRRDTFDRRSPPAPRNRSRTPPGKEYRDSRDSRDLPGRDLDLSRVTRNVRETGPLSATSTHSDSPFSGGGYFRGSSFRGRGRGDWDGRGRGRGFTEDRDGFRPRSRSRDRMTRDFRDDRSREHDRDSSRRDEDKKPEWDRDSDRYRKDPPLRPESRNSTGSQNNSASPLIPSAPFKDNRQSGYFQDSGRRSSFAVPQIKPEVSRNAATPQPPSSPMPSVQVPMFGTFNPSAIGPASKPSTAQTSPKEASPNPGRSDPLKVAPKAPKADLNAQPPLGPKASATFQRRPPFSLNSPVRGYDAHHESPVGQSPAASRFSGPSTPSSAPHSTGPSRIRAFAPWGSPELGSRPSPSEAPTSMQRFQGHDMPPTSSTSVNTSPRIPTGPKASQPSIRAPMNTRGSKPGAMTWVNPRLQRPSIMQPLAQNASRKDDESAMRPSTSSSNREISRKTSRTLSVGNGPSAGDLVGLKQGFLDVHPDKQDTQAPSEATSTRAATPEDEDEDAVDDDLDQEDFDEQERQFVRDMDALRSKKAPPPTENPTLLVLLEELDALASAAEDLENGVLPPPKVEEPSRATVPATMPTPPNDAAGIKKSDEPMEFKLEGEGTDLVDLPLEGLPHLINGIPTPISEVDFVDIKDCEEELCQKIRDTLAVESQTDEELRQEFARLYREWRDEVDALDEEKRELEETTEEKRGPTPLPELPPESAPLPAVQNEPVGRRGLFASEEEINKLMNETKVESDMKTMQRTQDAQEKADPNREAPIPDMLTLEEQKVYMFEDVNNYVNAASVLKVFGFVPPSDDFNDDEQDSFKEAYVATPKKWGHIAQTVNEAKFEVHAQNRNEDKFRPRDFHDCIRHYYLTKKECVYKNLQTRRGRKRRGQLKGKRGANTIMGSGSLAEDIGPSPSKVTETGRPKRAAAPNFNDKEKKEGDTVSGRGGGGISRRGGAGSSASTRPSGAAGESAPEKTPARRGRQPNKDKGAKRGNHKPTILAPNVSPIKKVVDNEVTMTDAPPNEGIPARDLETAEVLARFRAASTSSQQQPPVLMPQKSPPESWRGESKLPLAGSAMQMPAVVPPQSLSANDSLLGMRVTLGPGPQVPPAHLQSQPQISSTTSAHTSATAPAIIPPTSLQQAHPLISASQVPPSTSQSAVPPPIEIAPAKLAPGGRNPATSSYWSVQEQQDFDALIRHYGRNWEAVGKEMPAKTETMVKNHFMRQVSQQNREDLKQWADDADQRNKGNAPSAPLLDPARTITTATGTGNPGRGRRQTVNNSSQRILAPNPDQVQPETTISAPLDPIQSSSTIGSQISAQERGHARLAIAPQRPQPIAPSSAGVIEQSSVENPAHLLRYQDPAHSTHPILPSHKEKLQTQPPQSQPTIHQAQQPFQAAQLSRFASDLPRDPTASSNQPSAKRPRSQTEQELLEREQPPKRQGVEFEVFTSALAQQHERQHQQRTAVRSEQQSPYEYKAPKQQAQQQQQQQHGQLPSIPRTGSNPEEVDRLVRVRPIQPSVSPREQRRDSFSGGPQYLQPSLQPNLQQHVHSAAQPSTSQTVMQAAMQIRPMMGSPAQRTPPEISRPNSVTAPPVAQPPPRPISQAPAKRSNLMSLLNDEPSEPPPRTSSTETKPAPPPPQRRASPLTQVSMYQTPSQPASSYSRREMILDPVREAHSGIGSRHAYTQQAYSTPASHSLSYREPSQQQQQQSYSAHQHSHQQPPSYQPQQHHQHQPSQPKETLSWPTNRSYYSESIRPPIEPPRPLYQQHPPTAASPPPQAPAGSSHSSSSAYTMHSSRSSAYHNPQHQPSQPPQQLDGPSHTPHPHSHSRASSLAGPGQALAPSPYASIRPTSTLGSSLQSHGPPQPLSPQLPSYYGPGPGHGPSHGAAGGGRNAFAGLGGEHEGMRSAHASESSRGAMSREEALSGHAPRRYTPTQTPPSGGGYGYPPPPIQQHAQGQGSDRERERAKEEQMERERERERGGWGLR